MAKQKVASLNLTTGAPLTTFGFTNSTNNQVTALAATNSTLYVGGRFSRINGELMTGLAAVNAASGAVDMTFDNQLAGGIGVNGQLGVPQLKLTHDNSKLLVVHTGRQIDGQDRLGMGIIDTATKELLPVPQHPVGPEPRPRRRGHPDLRRRHRARRLLLHRVQRLGW